MLSRSELWLVLLIGTVCALVDFLMQTAFPIQFSTTMTVLAPTEFSILNWGGMRDFFLILTPLLAAFPCAWFYHEESENHSVIVYCTRGKAAHYYCGKALVVAVTAFAVTALPLLINQMFTLLAAPFPVYGIFSNGVYPGHAGRRGLGVESFGVTLHVMFPGLYMNAPLLDALVHMGLFGLFGAAMGLLSYAVSLFCRKNLVITLAAPAVLALVYLLLMNVSGLGILVVQSVLHAAPAFSRNVHFSEQKTIGCILQLLLFFAAGFVLLHRKIKKCGDILT
ncbi:MAG: hypothetical protein LBF64_02310 [Oscillospiraceae bacterium]|nr:hypothetical protein [Oscillospiraceae bacterium]